MKNKITILFAALMMTLGVCAQEGSTVEQRGAEKGYYPFAAEITGKEKLTSLDQIEDNMEIMIERDGSYLTIYSLPTYGAAHTVFMQTKPVGVGVWTTKIVDANAGTFQLKSAHMMIIGGDAKCYLGQLDYNSQDKTYLSTTGIDSNIGTYKFVPAADSSGKWNIQCANNSKQTYLAVDNSNKITEESNITNQTYFNIYKVTSKSTSQVKYVEASVKLTGQGGNTITGTHQGWNDFYEFNMSGDAYGCDVSNVYYNEETNTITGDINFPFPVTGDYVQVPVYLHANANTSKRVAVIDGTLKVIDNEEGDANPNSQWYIRPRIEGLKITYALQNVGTGKYITHNSSNTTISLSNDASYFDLTSNAAKDAFRFTFKYTNQAGVTYTALLYNNSGSLISGDYSWATGSNFLVSTVASTNTDLGFIQKYPAGTSFWNKGTVDINDETQCPTSVKSMLEDQEHEFKDATHKIYCASTAIKVNSRSDVTVTFTYDGGGHLLNIFGVDIFHLDGTAISHDYHQGTAGTSPNKNTYTLKNVPAGEYRIRYFVCNTPELTGDKGHNLDKNAGTITVTGANLRLKSSDAPNGDWADNTNWYTINQGLCTGNRICAEPAYTDWSNNLMLDNNDVAMNSAALWCFVGNDTEGYKIYNRAWGADYALATTGSEGEARTMMKPVAEASTYDVVFHAFNSGKGQFFIRTHGSENDFLNDRGEYLAKLNAVDAYDAEGSVMMINEVLNTEVFDDGLTPVVEKLQKEWAPWTGDGANDDINTAYANNSSFASWVLGRQQLAELLNGKVFKFVNKATDDRDDRALGVIEVNGEKYMGGVTPNNKFNGYLQLFSNNDGTYKLFHIGTNKYFQTPNAATITENANEASAYTYEVFEDEKQALHFVTGNEHMHLGNWGHSYKTTNWGGIDSEASRWNVIYNADAQDLADILARARAEQARVTTDGYKTNYPGFATTDAIASLNSEISDALESTEDKFGEVVNTLKENISNLLSPGFFTFKYTDNLYLNDDRKNQSETQRTLKEKDEVKSLFYYNDKKTLVGYASGNGFLYGVCNATSIKTAAEYNTFTFEPSTQEVEKFFVKSGSGTGFNDTYANDYYFKVNQDCIDRTINPSEYATWTIEAVTELPVKLNQADDGYAYATLYTPVALTIIDAVEAYTGVVSDDRNYLLLTKLDGVIPAGTGVVLKTTNTAETGIYNFAITTSEATADANNVLMGDIFTTLNEATYYSLNNVDGIGFYKYTGANLSGFRARISGEDADVTKLTFRFGNPTGIEGITSAPQNEVVYDLSGRRVATPKKGLYIVNGKKVFIK